MPKNRPLIYPCHGCYLSPNGGGFCGDECEMYRAYKREEAKQERERRQNKERGPWWKR